MAISVVSKVDDTTKAILTASGAESESGTLYSSETLVSLANVYYEIRGTDEAVGVATLTLGEDTISLTGFGNWGLKGGEKRLTPKQELNTATELKITTDANVSKFNMAVELHKETERYPG
jgi:hypothetical protein